MSIYVEINKSGNKMVATLFAEQNHGLSAFFDCFVSQQVQFNTTFYASPAVLVSVHHDFDRRVKKHIPPEYNIITAWIEVRCGPLLQVYQWQLSPH